MDHAGHDMNYRRLLAMAALSFVSMYALMYAMVDIFSNVYSNLNQFYMAGLMSAPMVLIELALMGAMYRDKRRNAIVAGAAVAVFVGCFLLIRQQTGITDRQFLRSMIPHHAGALLMCRQAPVEDPEIQTLCQSILASQKAEIDQMKAILERL